MLRSRPSTWFFAIERNCSGRQSHDESYYILDARPRAPVYVVPKEDIDRYAMLAELRAAQQGNGVFCPDKHVNAGPARNLDHFLIPAGTVHRSGPTAWVSEISSTQYIFTFKVRDWDRPGLGGRPRPIHLEQARKHYDGGLQPTSRSAVWSCRLDPNLFIRFDMFDTDGGIWETYQRPHRGGIQLVLLVEVIVSALRSQDPSYRREAIRDDIEGAYIHIFRSSPEELQNQLDQLEE